MSVTDPHELRDTLAAARFSGFARAHASDFAFVHTRQDEFLPSLLFAKRPNSSSDFFCPHFLQIFDIGSRGIM